ncbi:MAG TPA: serine/threonine-protein kinase [Polyangia bacterium]|jgi:serine/threonine-protein kinase
MDLPIGTVLGDAYEIIRPIGIGGMGSIYEAAQVRTRKRVAIKMMSKELAAHPEALARFRREVKVTTELAHPHIIEVLDFGASPTGEPYLVMEYLDGEDLEQRLERVGRLQPRTAAEIIKQLGSALAVAHAEGIVHRDLKPGNVFLLRVPGDAVFVKVVDFGISKVLKAATTKLTMARAVVGTPEFMAPEQAAGRVDWVDHRSDQWALACLAWHMLSGRLPFWQPEVADILNQVITGEPTPLLPELVGFISPPVDKVLRRALSKRREDRFPTITSFARAFEAAVMEGAPGPEIGRTPSQRVSGARPAVPGRGRSRFWLSLGVVVVALAAAGWLFRAEITSSKWWPGAGAGRAHSSDGANGDSPAPGDGEHHRRRPPRRP